ncbi:MAG TPA: CHAD domain-containing protein [Solirubrobacterales bacterium]|nr:CHAD domain-containing protein [Solirubrobacterales bacterium]
MKARQVKKLDPERSLGENAARIIEVRLDEMMDLAPRALDGSTKAQHDMRIAAKRLRYVLEVTGFIFGKPADTARRRARDLQDILGEIHDCDVMLPRVRDHAKGLQRRDAASVRARAGRAPDLDPRLAARAPHRTAYRGLDVLAVYLGARRELLEDRFHDFWKRQEQTGTWVRLERTVEAHLGRAREARRTAKAAERARERAEAAERAARQAEAQAEQARLDRERAYTERPEQSPMERVPGRSPGDAGTPPVDPA